MKQQIIEADVGFHRFPTSMTARVQPARDSVIRLHSVGLGLPQLQKQYGMARRRSVSDLPGRGWGGSDPPASDDCHLLESGVKDVVSTETDWTGQGMGVLGHEARFPTPRLSAGCGFRKETIAGMRRNGRDAPIPDLPPSPRNGEVRPEAAVGSSNRHRALDRRPGAGSVHSSSISWFGAEREQSGERAGNARTLPIV